MFENFRYSAKYRTQTGNTHTHTYTYTHCERLECCLRAAKKLKNEKAAEPDGIPPELLKKELSPISEPFKRFLRVWTAGNGPQ